MDINKSNKTRTKTGETPNVAPKKSNLRPPWKPGESGNLKGREKGTKNFETYFNEAWKEVAEALKMGKDPDVGKVQILKAGIKEIFKGNYPFAKDFMERLFGKVQDNIKLDFPENLIDLIKNVTDKTQR